MAVTQLSFTFTAEKAKSVKEQWGHAGVVGSGDLEVLIEKENNEGKAVFQVNTKVVGFDEVWEAVLQRFVSRSGLGNVRVSINDNAATPAVVTKRLQQAINAAGGLE